MRKVQEIAEALHVLPKLRLGIKRDGGGVDPTGPHKVKFLTDAVVVMGKDNENKPRKEMKFEVEENGIRYRWQVPIMNKTGDQASYIIEKLMHLEIGDERILEMRRQGGRAGWFIDVRKVDEEPEEAPDDDDGGLPPEDEIEKTLEQESGKPTL